MFDCTTSFIRVWGASCGNCLRRLSGNAPTIFLLLMLGCGTAELPRTSVSPEVEKPVANVLLLTDHPLVSKIWDANNKKWVLEADLYRAIQGSPVVLIGETHDNHQHHRLQHQMLAMLSTQRQPRALVMEQFDVDHQAAISDAHRALKQPDDLGIDARRMWLHDASEEIANAGKLNRRGWQWPQYQPLIETAIQSNWPVVAANLSRADARNVFATGFSAIPDKALSVEERAAFFTATWNSRRNDAVLKTMTDSHCGQLSAERAPGMVNAQRARDAVMANAVLTHKKTGAVLIAGRGHVRHDVGVPLYIREIEMRRAKLPGADQDIWPLSIGLVEVTANKNSVDDYDELNSAEISIAPFDYVWFSARQQRKDPCGGMTLGKMAK
jgi:uncharacterized iron-regulated protein